MLTESCKFLTRRLNSCKLASPRLMKTLSCLQIADHLCQCVRMVYTWAFSSHRTIFLHFFFNDYQSLWIPKLFSCSFCSPSGHFHHVTKTTPHRRGGAVASQVWSAESGSLVLCAALSTLSFHSWNTAPLSSFSLGHPSFSLGWSG